MVDSIFECGVCFKPYNHQDKKPLSLPCGHSFCLECMRQMVKHQQICCPYDKSFHSCVPENLPVNYQVLSGLPMNTNQAQAAAAQAVSTTSQNPAECSISYCTTHPSKKIKFFCKNDQELFCSKCILKHTQQKHEVINCSPKIVDMKKMI